MAENRYEITRLLGKGRTGGVYEAEDKNLNRKVAMRRFFDQGNRVDFTQHKEDFLQVARSLSNLQHPNLLRVFDAGVDEDGAYVVSQLLEGKSLHQETKKGEMPLAEVVEMAKQMLDAFSMAHDIGYFHGALTPDSIFMVPRARGGYRYVILDMGLSRLAPLIQGKDSVLAVMADRAILSPELFDGGIADARADLYMLGQILFMCIAGGHPFGGLSIEEAKKKHLKGLPSIKKYNSDVSRAMAEWLATLTSVNPEDRPDSAVEALRALQLISSSSNDTSAQMILSGKVSIKDGDTDNTDGPVPILPPGVNPDDIPTAPIIKMRNKKPWVPIVLGAGVIIAAVVVVMLMSGDGDDVRDEQSEETNEPLDRAKLDPLEQNLAIDVLSEKEISNIEPMAQGNPPAVVRDRLVYFGEKIAEHDGWVKIWPSLQRVGESGAGWLIEDTDSRSFTGVKYSLNEHTNKMFDRGWHLTYRFQVGSGSHRIGFTLDDEMNPGWLGNGEISCCVVVKSEGEKITFYSPKNEKYAFNESKSHELEYVTGLKEEVTVTIGQGSMDASGGFEVKVNGALAYKDHFTHNVNYLEGDKWINHLFCSTLDKVSKPSWLIKEIKLETL